MISETTIAQSIERCATAPPDRGYRFVLDDKWTESFHSFTKLEAETRGIAGALQHAGLAKGDRAALILPDNEVFVPLFLACLRAGIVPVPIYPPTGLGQLSGYLENTSHIVRRSGARMLVTTPMIKQLLGSVQAACPELDRVVNQASILQSEAPFKPVDLSPEDTAFLQFTSGSTAQPKGVILTHANLHANIRNILELGLKSNNEIDTGVTWLPLFHDMGLIGFVIASLAHTISVSFMSPLMFLKRPAVWLQAMSRYRGTITFGPNFAYALAVKRIRERDLQGVDLSAWRVAGCGAEPIRAETLETFATTFAPYGFRKEAFYPAYGMAESTLAISFAQSVPTDCVRASVLWEQGRAVACDSSEDPDCLRVVSCGKAFDGHCVGAFASDDELSAHPLPDRTVGELRLHGPSVTPGYFDDPDLTREAFAGGWLKTGDLGYLVGGDVFICGRSKEVVIVNGRNFYPQDLEWQASQVQGVRKGNVIAFGCSSEEGDRENVVVAFETAAQEPEHRARMCNEVRTRVQETIGLVVDDVVCVAAGVLPKTSSGKLQRTRTRELYETGQLTVRKGARDVDRVDQVRHIARSQLEYLKLAVFGSRRRKQP